MHLVSLVAAAVLTSAFVYFIFLRAGADFDAGWKIGFGAAIAVGVFLTVVFTFRLIRNPPYFVLYEHGFEYSPGGVSTGLIKWTDVLELREESVLNSLAGTPGRRAVTAVVLRNPEELVRRFPAALRPLFELRMKMNSSPILIARGEFGGDSTALMTILREQVAKANARKS